MARQILIDFDIATDKNSVIHRVRNFGEDLYRMGLRDGLASISLDDVDRATSQLRVTVYSARKVRRVSSAVENYLKRTA